MEWREVASAAIYGLWAIVLGMAGAMWSMVSRNRDEIVRLERHLTETYARRDHLENQISQLVTEVRELRALVLKIIEKE